MDCKPFPLSYPFCFLIATLKPEHLNHFLRLLNPVSALVQKRPSSSRALQLDAGVAGSWLSGETVPCPSHFLPSLAKLQENIRVLLWHFHQESLRPYQSTFTSYCSSNLRKIPHRHCIGLSMKRINCQNTQEGDLGSYLHFPQDNWLPVRAEKVQVSDIQRGEGGDMFPLTISSWVGEFRC